MYLRFEIKSNNQIELLRGFMIGKKLGGTSYIALPNADYRHVILVLPIGCITKCIELEFIEILYYQYEGNGKTFNSKHPLYTTSSVVCEMESGDWKKPVITRAWIEAERIREELQ
jgi:hypothetical protein